MDLPDSRCADILSWPKVKICFFAAMSLFIASLNSGSNGNCYYLGNDSEAILIDVGISCREIEKRMRQLGLDMYKIKAVFVSHEHSDHIKGIAVLTKKYRLPLYITADTLLHSRLRIDPEMLRHFSINEQVDIGSISITSFSKRHDACDPCSFIISSNRIKVGVFTDIGFACENVISHFQLCHAAFLEANYDEEMLEKGSYPYHLKRRIRGGFGHLSNKQALDLFLKYRPSFMSHLLLSHLSQNNNSPELVNELFNNNRGNVEIVVASRHEVTPVYHISQAIAAVKNLRTKRIITRQLEFAFL